MKKLLIIINILSLSLLSNWRIHAKVNKTLYQEGTVVIDQYNEVGVVKNIKGKSISYQVKNFTRTTDKSNLSVEINKHDHFKKGDTVIDCYNRIGTINKIFANDKIEYQLHNINQIAHSSNNLILQVEQFNDIKANDKIIDQYDRIGEVLNVFENGMIVYKFNNQIQFSKNISKEIDTLQKIKKGTVVIDQYDRIGVVQDIFNNGKFRYQVGKIPIISTIVSPEITHIDTIQKKHLVMDQYGRIGEVEYVFKNLKVAYIIDHQRYISSNVSPEVTDFELGQDIYPGVVILDQYNRTGIVQHVFKNGKVYFELNTGNGFSDLVSPEINENDKYSKQAIYSTDWGDILQPTNYFKDGRVLGKNLNGDKIVAQKLYPEVSSWEDVNIGSRIIRPTGSTGTIKSIFKNGVVIYEEDEKKEGDRHQLVSAMMFKNTDQEKGVWLKSMAKEGAFYITSRLVMLESQYPDYCKNLLKYCKKNKKNLLISSDKIKKIIQLLESKSTKVAG